MARKFYNLFRQIVPEDAVGDSCSALLTVIEAVACISDDSAVAYSWVALVGVDTLGSIFGYHAVGDCCSTATLLARDAGACISGDDAVTYSWLAVVRIDTLSSIFGNDAVTYCWVASIGVDTLSSIFGNDAVSDCGGCT